MCSVWNVSKPATRRAKENVQSVMLALVLMTFIDFILHSLLCHFMCIFCIYYYYDYKIMSFIVIESILNYNTMFYQI